MISQDNLIFNLIREERNRQDKRWGHPTSRKMSLVFWYTILMEEIGEVGRAILKRNLLNLQEELIHSCAVLICILTVIANTQTFEYGTESEDS